MTKQDNDARRLISFIHRECGEHLATLLLGDYGSRQRRLSHIFLLSLSGDRELPLKVEITTDHKWGLTCGREPLVIIALLQSLFLRNELRTGRASYSYQEVLHLLGWRDTKESRDDIRDALDITFIQSFNLSADLHDPATPMSYLRRQHMLKGYEFIAGTGPATRSSTASYRGDFLIDFDLDFIISLRARRLLGIDWNLVTSVTRSHEFEGLSEEPD
ncbi:MAG: hypothetical protein WCF57_24365 [Pyrinomonadaceae bacterium]